MSSTSERMAKLSPEKLALLKKAMGESDRIAEPIAVVGLGCRFAGAANIAEYWQLIRDGLDMTGEIPASRWDVDAFFDATGKTPGKMTTRWGGFLDDIDLFDAAFFGISPREAEKMDVQHRLLLQVVWEALEFGGISPTSLRESSTGVFVGVGGTDYSRIPVQLDNYFEQITAYSGTGNALSIAANRLSYTLDLRGPSMSIDTACSSSLVAAHLAIRSLRSNECDAAIVGGVNAILTPETTLAFTQAHMLSPDGKCRPFDDQANGYVRGEGCGIVILKRLSDAVSNGDMILATIRGSAVNQDGLTSGITAPRGTAQVEVIRRALRDARCSPDDVSYVEAHGTATPLGDPIELGALAEVFRARGAEGEQPCYLGSVKANIGHTETAAGMASLIKTVLMLSNQTIPAQTHFQKLNPHAGIDQSRLQVAQQMMRWNGVKGAAIAGISSFGFGGTNAHLVLEAARAAEVDSASNGRGTLTDAAEHKVDRPKHLLTLSAKSPKQLRNLAGRFSESITDTTSYPLADVCYTAAVGRAAFKHRLAVSTGDAAELKQILATFASGENSRRVKQAAVKGDRRRKIAFLFPGQGAQSPGMGRELFETHPVFREALEACDEILADLLPHRLLHVLYEDQSDEPLIHQTQYTQPALFAIEYAMSRLWRSFGIEPTVMLGHSIGDYVAACEAGVFSLRDGLTLIAHRGRLVQSLPRDGSMAVVFTDRERVVDLILPYECDVAIAAHNGPESVTIAGRTEVVTDLLSQFETAGVKTRALEVSHAMHSPLLDPILDEFERFASEVTFQSPKITLISSHDGKKLDDRVCQPSYWRSHLRHTVCFVDATRTLEAFPLEAAIEIGPGTTLCGLASRMWSSEPIAWLPSLRAGRDDWDVMNESVAELFVRGVNVDWKAFDKPFSRKRVVLPTYPFELQRHWYDMSHWQDRRTNAVLSIATGETHPLVGMRLPMAGDKTIFQQTLEAQHPAFLDDHRLDQTPVVPAAAYMEQSLAIARELFGAGAHHLTNLAIDQPLVLTGENRRTVQLHVGPDLRGERSIEIYSRPYANDQDVAESWTLHASGTLNNVAETDSVPDAMDPAAIMQRMTHRIDGESFYRRMAACGLQYGPMFQVVTELHAGADECLCQMQLSEPLQKDLSDYILHPAVMDGCLQSIAGVVIDPEDESVADLVLPTHAERVRVYRDLPAGPLWVYTRGSNAASATDTFDADIVLLADDGAVVAEISGARVQRVAKQRSSRQAKPEDLLYQTHWQASPLASSATDDRDQSRRWVLFADSAGLADQMADQFRQQGDDVCVVRPGTEFSFASSDDDEKASSCVLNPLERDDYERLFAELGERSDGQFSIVNMWGIGKSEGDLSDEAELAHSICSHALLLLATLAKTSSVKIGRIHWVTRGANAVSDIDAVIPSQASLWGLGRTAIVEMPHLKLRFIDLDSSESTDSSIDSLRNELLANKNDETAGEDHVAYRSGSRYVARLERVPELFQSTPGSRQSLPASERYSLRLGDSPSFDELHYVPVGGKTLAPNEVEIEVRSTGLNFSDVLKALGLYPGVKDEIVPLGIECAGVVSRVGDAVDRFQPGQRVMGVAPYSFASHTTTADYAIVATPDNLSDEDAATIPITFLTAHHALCSLARLGKNERVLIHAGAGGVGLAAIQIAQAVGAEIFATAGSDSKREFLRSLGVQHVMDSRTLDFADEILEITSGHGVDVVLNSLPGEAITKSLSILAAYGRFLEIGKTDIYQNRRIGLWPFQDNLSYHAIDLDRMLRQRPDDIQRLYSEIGPLFEKGVYRPLPLTSFAPEAIVDAFRYMSQRKNIGKVVVSFPDRQSQKQHDVAPESVEGELQSGEPRAASLADGTVLITGGLGAIGRQVAKYAVTHGASHLAILTRRGADDVKEELTQIEAPGVSVVVLQGDVSDRSSLAAALEQLPAAFPAIRSVFHAAGVLRDGLMQTMELDHLHEAMAPKTRGAWNLHLALSEPLDFFVMFSSVAGTMGSPGQGNYAAGNAFLDAIALHRRRMGMPATSIAWGPWDAEGMAATPEVRRQLAERGMTPLMPQTAMHVLDQAIHQDTTPFAVMNVNWSVLLSKMVGGGPSLLSAFRSSTESEEKTKSSGGRDERLFARLKAAEPNERLIELQSFVATALADVMGIDAETIDADQPLASLGLDSLMGMELRSKLESQLGIELPMSALFDNPSVLSLARVASSAYDDVASDAGGAAVSQTDQASAAKPASSGAVRAEPRSKPGIVSLGGTQGEGAPVFCLHPVGGDLRCYDSLARTMKDRPVYGLRAQGLQAGSVAHETMDALVSDYIQIIRETYPEGPYNLVGWSTGGIFAYEIARRLQENQHAVQSLIMIDSPLPVVFESVDLDDNAMFLVDLVEFANYFAGTSMEITYEALHQLSEKDALDFVLRLSIDHGVLPAKTTPMYLERLINVCKQHVKILQGYQPPPSDLAAEMLRPEVTGLLTHATGHSFDDDLGWGKIVQLRLHQVSGHHFTMMTAPNVFSMAEKISDLLSEPSLPSM
ncbi:type I polyketide synthase [Aporhodopirellula aestuarii]|uniref:SDR family NAD(P)-dependent oxidoreductase n=1 Tax=Aporhodopirellula aestuarii TaxID=2950107 RepID=A0ABT0TXQ6_9BACT|nr:type I polyketide synthase [Aporhodopirellula aestuarii]MCM2369159.1 SDR family NAD(P)-dependent oxidoreductase [Aporhodopirellula aestuarii]